MQKLARRLFRDEFVVDEEPQEVAELDLAGQHDAMTWRSKPEGTGADGEAAPRKGRDLRTEISQLLKEQDRLESLARDLRRRGDRTTAQEMRRFFRMALPTLDSFDRIVSMAEEQEMSEELKNWLKSVAVVQSRMTELFEEFGLQTMDPVGKPVNLDRHEVVEVVHTNSVPDETVVETRQKGYLFDDKVLRDARVVVAKRQE